MKPTVISVGVQRTFAVTPAPGASIDVSVPQFSVDPLVAGRSNLPDPVSASSPVAPTRAYQARGSLIVTNVGSDGAIVLSIDAIAASVIAVSTRHSETAIVSTTTFVPGVGTPLAELTGVAIAFKSTFRAPFHTSAIRITINVTAAGMTRSATASADLR